MLARARGGRQARCCACAVHRSVRESGEGRKEEPRGTQARYDVDRLGVRGAPRAKPVVKVSKTAPPSPDPSSSPLQGYSMRRPAATAPASRRCSQTFDPLSTLFR